MGSIWTGDLLLYSVVGGGNFHSENFFHSRGCRYLGYLGTLDTLNILDTVDALDALDTLDTSDTSDASDTLDTYSRRKIQERVHILENDTIQSSG